MNFWENSFGYVISRRYTDLCTRTGFSTIKVIGRDRIPAEGAVLLASNHCASLMDPLLDLLLRRWSPIAFGARSDVFSSPAVSKILRWLKILPIARQRNGLQEVAKNFEVFDEAIDCIGHGTPFCLYVEGMHRAARGMLPVKKGIFRVAKMAVERLEGPVWVVPVGVDYEYLFLEGGKAVVTVGEPVEMRSYFAAHSEECEADVYRGLCELFQTRMEALIGHLIPQSEVRTCVLSPAHVALKCLLGVLLLPFAVALAAATAIYWIPALLILRKMKDKAWTHTVFFAVRFLLPVLWLFIWPAGVLNAFYYELIKEIKK